MDERSLRSNIDAVLARARAELDRRSRDDAPVVMTASLDETMVRVRTSAATAVARARELAASGWTVEFRDLLGRQIPWSEREGLLEIPAAEPAPAEHIPVIAEEMLPTPRTVAVDRLRETA